MLAYYLPIKIIHMSSFTVSLVLFLVRAGLLAANSPVRSAKVLRILPHIVDTVLLVSAFTLAAIIQQYPFVDGWLTVKLLALVAYIALGVIAFRAKQPAVRYAALFAALATFAFIISVAIKHDPRGFFA